MTSIPAPDLHGRTFHSVLVVAQIADLGLRLAMEDRFTSLRVPLELCEEVVSGTGYADPSKRDSTRAACAKRNADRVARATRFVPSHSVFFAGREYSSEQVVAALRQNGIDGTLVIIPGEAGSSQTYVPPTYTTQCTGFSPYSGCTQVTTTTAGGSSYSKPWVQFSAKLYDAANGEGVWVATATTGGNAFAQSVDLVRSMADKTRERLLADRVIQIH
jgi:hypothetical protein